MSNDTRQVTVNKLDERVPLALHRHYDGQIDPQPCHIALDLDNGRLSADYNPEIGNAIPASVFHGRIRWWLIPCLTAASANQLLRDLAPLAQRVLAGSSVEWDGNNNVGVLTPDAQVAERELVDRIDRLTDKLDQVIELDAADWFSEGDLPAKLTATTTDKQLAEIVAEQEREAATMESGVYTVLLGAEAYLTNRRDELALSRDGS